MEMPTLLSDAVAELSQWTLGPPKAKNGEIKDRGGSRRRIGIPTATHTILVTAAATAVQNLAQQSHPTSGSTRQTGRRRETEASTSSRDNTAAAGQKQEAEPRSPNKQPNNKQHSRQKQRPNRPRPGPNTKGPRRRTSQRNKNQQGADNTHTRAPGAPHTRRAHTPKTHHAARAHAKAQPN